MTTITLKSELIEKIFEKWQKEHPLETENSKTKVVERICIKYLNHKGEK